VATVVNSLWMCVGIMDIQAVQCVILDWKLEHMVWDDINQRLQDFETELVLDCFHSYHKDNQTMDRHNGGIGSPTYILSFRKY
jgi:hypothetical protein